MSVSSAIQKAYWLAAGRVQDLGPSSATDLREPTQDRLGLYCLDFRPATTSGRFSTFDDEGISMQIRSKGVREYSLTGVASYGMACLQYLGITGEDAWREAFLKQMNWLVDKAENHETGGLVWRYDYGKLPAGWISAMMQGQAISVLCRAYLLTENQVFLDVASRASEVFAVPVERGGVASRFPETGEVCYEETPETKPSRVLNGWIFGLWGLADLAETTGCADAERMYRQGVVSLQNHAADYDTGWWSYYDLPDGSPPRLASVHYHIIDTWLLEALAKRTGEKAFAIRAEQWEKYSKSLLCRLRALSGKLVQGIRYGY